MNKLLARLLWAIPLLSLMLLLQGCDEEQKVAWWLPAPWLPFSAGAASGAFGTAGQTPAAGQAAGGAVAGQ